MLLKNGFQLSDFGGLGDILFGPDGHSCLGVDGFVHLGADAGNVFGDLSAVDVKVDASGVGGCHTEKIRSPTQTLPEREGLKKLRLFVDQIWRVAIGRERTVNKTWFDRRSIGCA